MVPSFTYNFVDDGPAENGVDDDDDADDQPDSVGAMVGDEDSDQEGADPEATQKGTVEPMVTKATSSASVTDDNLQTLVQAALAQLVKSGSLPTHCMTPPAKKRPVEGTAETVANAPGSPKATLSASSTKTVGLKRRRGPSQAVAAAAEAEFKPKRRLPVKASG